MNSKFAEKTKVTRKVDQKELDLQY